MIIFGSPIVEQNYHLPDIFVETNTYADFYKNWHPPEKRMQFRIVKAKDNHMKSTQGFRNLTF